MSEAFCTEMIREFVMPNEKVLDPFMGLATTGIVCNKLHHDFVGIEIYKKYFDLAKKRMDQATAQIDVFDLMKQEGKETMNDLYELLKQKLNCMRDESSQLVIFSFEEVSQLYQFVCFMKQVKELVNWGDD